MYIDFNDESQMICIFSCMLLLKFYFLLKMLNSCTKIISSYSIPSRYESFWKEVDYVKHLWKNRHELKVEDAGIAALFGIECFAWYCAGEIVGRGFQFTGYYV